MSIIIGIPLIIIYFIALVVLVLIDASTNILLAVAGKGLLIICIIMVIKNLIQDIGFGIIKYRNYVCGLISIPINLLRIGYFYKLIKNAIHLLDGGLAMLGFFEYYSNVFIFFFVLLLGCAFFFGAEYCAVSIATNDYSIGDVEFDSAAGCVIGNITITAIFILFFEVVFPMV